MANPIQNNEIADAKIFESLIEGGNRLIKVIDDLTNRSKSFASEAEKALTDLDFSKTKDSETLNKILEQLVDITKDVTKAQKQRVKTADDLTKQEKELNRILSDSKEFNEGLAVEIQKVKIQRTEATKAAKAEAKEVLGLNSTYDKQRARLNELTKSLINLRLEGKAGSEVFQQQEKEFQELFESVKKAEEEFGRFQRNVGNYPQDANKASRATERLSRQLSRLQSGAIAIGAVAVGGGLLGNLLKRTEDGFEGVRIATEAFNAGINQLVGPVIKGLVRGFQNAGQNATGLQKVYSGLEEAVLSLEESFTKLGPTLEQQLILSQRLIEFEKTLRTSIRGRRETEGSVLTELNVVPGLLEQAAQQSRLLEVSLAQIDRNTLSFTDRLNALNKARNLAFGVSVESNEKQLKALRDEEKILRSRRDLIKEGSDEFVELSNKIFEVQVKISEREELGNSVFALRKKIIEDELKIVKERLELAESNSENQIALEERFTQLRLERIQLANEESQLGLQLTESSIQLLQDQTEQELDILLDSFDTQRTINEKLILDERTSFEIRKKLIQSNKELAEAAFNAQIDAIVELENQRRNSGRKQSELSEKQKKELEDFRQELLKFTDASALEQQELLKSLELSENIGTRAIEISRERRIVESENAELQKQFIDDQVEAELQLEQIKIRSNALRELENTTNARKRKQIEDKLNEDLENAEVKSLQDRLENLKTFYEKQRELGIDNVEKSSQEELDLREKLNDKLIHLDEERVRKEKELLDKQLAAFEQGLSGAQQLISVLNEKAVADIDEKLSAVERRDAQLREALSRGALNTEDSLAQLDQERAKLQNERERELLRQARTELAISSLQAFGANVQAGAENPLTKTFVDVLALRSFWQSIPLFFKGTDDTGTVDSPLDSNGGRIAMLHDNEQIWSKKDRKAVGWRTRDEIKELVKIGEMASAIPHIPIDRPQVNVVNPFVAVDRLERIEKAIRELPERQPRETRRYDEESKMIVDIIQSKNKVERIHKRPGGLYG